MLRQDHEIKTPPGSLLPTCIKAAVTLSVPPHVPPTRSAILDGCVHMHSGVLCQHCGAATPPRLPHLCHGCDQVLRDIVVCQLPRVCAGGFGARGGGCALVRLGLQSEHDSDSDSDSADLLDRPRPLLKVWQAFCLLLHKQSDAEAGIQLLCKGGKKPPDPP